MSTDERPVPADEDIATALRTGLDAFELSEEDEALLLKMQDQFHGQLSFRADPTCHIEELTIVNATSGEELFNNRTR